MWENKVDCKKYHVNSVITKYKKNKGYNIEIKIWKKYNVCKYKIRKKARGKKYWTIYAIFTPFA